MGFHELDFMMWDLKMWIFMIYLMWDIIYWTFHDVNSFQWGFINWNFMMWGV